MSGYTDGAVSGLPSLGDWIREGLEDVADAARSVRKGIGEFDDIFGGGSSGGDADVTNKGNKTGKAPASGTDFTPFIIAGALVVVLVLVAR